jgi:hypothetical protein
VGGRTLRERSGCVGGRTRNGTRTTGSTSANEANPEARRRQPNSMDHSQGLSLRGQQVRRLFTPFDARADIILHPCRSPHGGRLKNPRTWAHAQGPSACAHLGLYGSAQGVRKWEGQRSRRSATRATAAQRPERTNKAFDFVAWKGGVACSEAVQTMAAWLALCSGLLAAMPRRLGRRLEMGGQPVRSLFTPFDARADIILGTDCGRHGGRLKNPRT